MTIKGILIGIAVFTGLWFLWCFVIKPMFDTAKVESQVKELLKPDQTYKDIAIAVANALGTGENQFFDLTSVFKDTSKVVALLAPLSKEELAKVRTYYTQVTGNSFWDKPNELTEDLQKSLSASEKKKIPNYQL